MRVAVYGSLKTGKGNHRIISDSKFLGTGETLSSFNMISFGGFPGVIPGDKKVHVEVYEVNPSILKDLDHLEGHPDFYERCAIPINLDNGEEIMAWMYILPQDRYSSRPFIKELDLNGRLNW